jgi:hypothetical protein
MLWATERVPGDDGPLYTGFQLDANGDQIAIYDNDGVTLIDSVVFGEQLVNVAYGRLPDGSEDMY